MFVYPGDSATATLRLRPCLRDVTRPSATTTFLVNIARLHLKYIYFNEYLFIGHFHRVKTGNRTYTASARLFDINFANLCPFKFYTKNVSCRGCPAYLTTVYIINKWHSSNVSLSFIDTTNMALFWKSRRLFYLTWSREITQNNAFLWKPTVDVSLKKTKQKNRKFLSWIIWYSRRRGQTRPFKG